MAVSTGWVALALSSWQLPASDPSFRSRDLSVRVKLVIRAISRRHWYTVAALTDSAERSPPPSFQLDPIPSFPTSQGATGPETQHMLPIPKNPDLTILVIAYNEEDAIGATVDELLAVQERLGFYARILVLDDGSTDRTAEIADELASLHPRVDVFHHEHNVGQFANIRKGLELTETRKFTLIPGDGQFDVTRFDLFLSCLETHDVIFGFPNNEEVRGRKRVVLSHAWRLYLLVLYGVSVTYLAGWVFAPTELVRRIPVRYGAFLGWYELATKLVLSGASYMQMPFDMRARLGGETKALSPMRNLTDLLRMLHVWWRSKGPGVVKGGRDYEALRQIYRDWKAETLESDSQRPVPARSQDLPGEATAPQNSPDQNSPDQNSPDQNSPDQNKADKPHHSEAATVPTGAS